MAYKTTEGGRPPRGNKDGYKGGRDGKPTYRPESGKYGTGGQKADDRGYGGRERTGERPYKSGGARGNDAYKGGRPSYQADRGGAQGNDAYRGGRPPYQTDRGRQGPADSREGYGRPDGKPGTFRKEPYEGPRYPKKGADGGYGKPYRGYDRPRDDRAADTDKKDRYPSDSARGAGSGQYAKPAGSGQYAKPAGSGQYARPAGSGQYARPAGNGFKKPYGNYENAPRDNKRPYRGPGGAGKGPEQRQDFRSDGRPGRYGERKPAYMDEKAEARPPYIPEDELPYLIMGRNAVREAIKSGRSINSILVIPEQDGSLKEVLGLARDNNIMIRETNRTKLDELCMPFGHGGKPGNHQGIVAMVPGVEYCEISDILNAAKERGEQPFVIVLDGIEDPHNLGSIIRSAECAGAHGIIIPKRRSASVTAAVAKASAGAVEYMKVARVANLGGAIDRLKDSGLWIMGAHMEGTPMDKADFGGALALIIGSEGSGISKLVKEKCDFLVSIPVFGKIESLNASVAAAILMYAKRGK